MGDKTKNLSTQKKVAIVLIICFVGGFMWWLFDPLSLLGPTEEEAVAPISSFALTSHADGEDVSWVEISLWIPDSDHDDEGFDDEEDKFILTNFDEEVQSKDAEDISIDLSEVIGPIWIEIDPDGDSYFENNFHLITGGVNENYTFSVYHRPSDVNINVLEWDDDLDEWDRTSDVNATVYLDVLQNSWNQLHKGTYWKTSTSDWDDMTAAEQADYRNQRYWRSFAPTYDPAEDLEKEYDNDLERLTDAPVVRFLFNDTINQTDGSVFQVNFTVLERNGADPPIEVVFASTAIYCIFTEAITFVNRPYSFDFEILMAANISDTSVSTGWLEVPRKDSNLGTFTLLSNAPI